MLLWSAAGLLIVDIVTAGGFLFRRWAPTARGGVGLYLGAHTHDGQIWPFGYFTARDYPLMGGRYDVNGMPAIVCRGTGTWGPRMRLWRPSEILRVTLRSPA